MTTINELSVRASNRVVGDEVIESGSRQDRAAPRLVVLIHGYQNKPDKAREAFATFRKRLDRAANGGEQRAGTMWEFHWPGDHPLAMISMATYPVRVGPAISSGQTLAREWLAKLDSSQRVYIVAHSLGCRVALEAVRTIRRAGDIWTGPHIEAVFLRAAAVPVPHCTADGHLGGPLRNSSEHVFYSTSDIVLSLAFRPGQFLASERGEAVGRHGLPRGRWASEIQTGLAHGSYWGSDDVASTIAERLGLRPWRTIHERRFAERDLTATTQPFDNHRLVSRPLPPRIL